MRTHDPKQPPLSLPRERWSFWVRKAKMTHELTLLHNFSFTDMFFALPARQVTFGRSAVPYQLPNQPSQFTGLAIPGAASYSLPAPSNLALPGPSPLSQSHTHSPSQPQPANGTSTTRNNTMSAAVAGPSTPPTNAVLTTPAPLTLEQQYITAVEGIVPTIQSSCHSQPRLPSRP